MALFRRRRSQSPDATTPEGSGDATPPGGIPRPSEMEQLRADLAAMQQRLDEVAAERAALHGQVRSLTERLQTPMAAPAQDASPAVQQRDVDLLRAQYVRLATRVDAVDAKVGQPEHDMTERLQALEAWVVHSTDDLVHRVGIVDAKVDKSATDLTTRLDTVESKADQSATDLTTRLDTVDAKLDKSATDLTTRLDTVDAKVDQSATDLTNRLDTVESKADQSTADLAARLEVVDARVTQVSSELANQLSELGTDIDELNRRAEQPPTEPATATLDHEVLEELLAPLRDSQTRLANEQARYQIAFRQDLAELADRLRRS